MRCAHSLTSRLRRSAVLAVCCAAGAVPAAEQVLEQAKRVHLGRPGQPEYAQFANPPTPPRAEPWEIEFEAAPNPGEHTLLLAQDDVKETWRVELNGQSLGALFAMEWPLYHRLAVPLGSLREGVNRLRFVPPREVDDIFIGDVRLVDRPAQSAVAQGAISVRVLEAGSGRPVPCRLTVVDEDGYLAALWAEPKPALAVRPGVVYTATGDAAMALRAGRYTVYATRGFEYGAARADVEVAAGRTNAIELRLRREVDTAGWIGADTHVHTLTYSGHGDATVEERAVTLAGEGVEWAVATDHNTLTDLTEAASRTGTAAHFTSVIGDEVTTRQAHFNVFPLQPEVRVPDFRILDWTRLFEQVRGVSGAGLIILNHPLNVHNDFQPFSPSLFNPVSGAMNAPVEGGFDAMELMNSSAQQADFMGPIRGWFALWNAGHAVVGVGSSDGHDVSRYLIGQGRTYVRAADGDPGRIDTPAVVASLRAGRALVSFGLLTELTVDGTNEAGGVARSRAAEIEVAILVRGPGWTAADRVQLFGNGVLLREEMLEPSTDAGVKFKAVWRLPRPRHDMHLSALATGPDPSQPYWSVPRPFQRRSPEWHPRIMGLTNPVWVDGDGDGRVEAPVVYARRAVEASGDDPQALMRRLASFDEAVAAQAAALCRRRGVDVAGGAWRAAWLDAPAPVRAGFESYVNTLGNR